MKFDSLYKIMVNEANESEDGAEISGEPVVDLEGGNTDAIGDALGGEGLAIMPETREEQIAYLTKALPEISVKNKSKTPEQLAANAAWIVDNDMFDAVYEAHEEKKAEMSKVLEPLPQDLETDKPTSEDLPDVPALGQHRREREEEERDQEELAPDMG